MNRIKWMRLSVRDLGDVIRWAGAQNAREIGEFRYRVVNGREIVSFRFVPRYAIDIGTREIVVVACARGTARRRLIVATKRVCRRLGRGFAGAFAWLTAPRPPRLTDAPARGGELHRLPLRAGSPSRL